MICPGLKYGDTVTVPEGVSAGDRMYAFVLKNQVLNFLVFESIMGLFRLRQRANTGFVGDQTGAVARGGVNFGPI